MAGMSGQLAIFQSAFVEALFGHSDHALACQRAFQVYRNTVFKGCIDALAANFPTVQRLVGEQWFAEAAYRYVQSTPPQHGRLVDYGAEFATFLADYQPASTLPYLADVARLDRLWLDVFCAADTPSLTLASLAGRAPQRLARQVLRPGPAVRWRWFEQPIYSIWNANRLQQPLPEPLPWCGEGALLFRRGPTAAVAWQALGQGACCFLDACAQGLPLEAAASLALESEPRLDFNLLLGQLCGAGIFTACE